MKIEINQFGFSILAMLISTRRGGALDCVRCSEADESERDTGEEDCKAMPQVPCFPPFGSIPGEVWVVFCSKVEGMLTAYYSQTDVNQTQVIKKRLCFRMLKDPLNGVSSHTCFTDKEALTYLTPFKEIYPEGSSFTYNGTICFCNDKDKCNGVAKSHLQNWILFSAITTILLLW